MGRKSRQFGPSIAIALGLSLSVVGNARADCAGDRAEYQQKCVVEYQRLQSPQVKDFYDSLCPKIAKAIEKTCAREGEGSDSTRSSGDSRATAPSGQASHQGARPSSGYSSSYGGPSATTRSNSNSGHGQSSGWDDANADATRCLSVRENHPSHDYFNWELSNNCPYKVSYNFCVETAMPGTSFTCGKDRGGSLLGGGQTTTIGHVTVRKGHSAHARIWVGACRWEPKPYNAAGISIGGSFKCNRF